MLTSTQLERFQMAVTQLRAGVAKFPTGYDYCLQELVLSEEAKAFELYAESHDTHVYNIVDCDWSAAASKAMLDEHEAVR